MLGHFYFEAIWKSEISDFQLEPLHILEDKPSRKRKKKSCNAFSDLKARKAAYTFLLLLIHRTIYYF